MKPTRPANREKDWPSGKQGHRREGKMPRRKHGETVSLHDDSSGQRHGSTQPHHQEGRGASSSSTVKRPYVRQTMRSSLPALHAGKVHFLISRRNLKHDFRDIRLLNVLVLSDHLTVCPMVNHFHRKFQLLGKPLSHRTH